MQISLREYIDRMKEGLKDTGGSVQEVSEALSLVDCMGNMLSYSGPHTC